jgi:hypothetical protein
VSEEPVHDERIMCDGRPAFAWWNEIQMLRADKARVDNLTQELLDMQALTGIVRTYLEEHPNTGDLVIRLSRLERIEARSTTLRGLIAEYVELERIAGGETT